MTPIFRIVIWTSITGLLLSGCITTNYYTGRTLERGKTIVTPGVDNLVWVEDKEGLVDKDLSFSKEIQGFQPYIGYYLNNHFAFEYDSDDILDYSIICFGLAIPNKGDLILPEINYYKGKFGDRGYYSFGIGIRAALHKKGTNK